ncbi:MAG: hypothetical protein NC250_00975 [Alistipes senegalensis]|nr:hypothetical protein [Alistipes senegalensis]
MEELLADRIIEQFEEAGISFDAYHEDSQKNIIAAYRQITPDFDESTLMSRFK